MIKWGPVIAPAADQAPTDLHALLDGARTNDPDFHIELVKVFDPTHLSGRGRVLPHRLPADG